MNSDWRPSFILAFSIFTAVLVAGISDGWAEKGEGGYTIGLAVMAVVMFITHKLTHKSDSGK